MAELNVQTLVSIRSREGDKFIANHGRSLVFLPEQIKEENKRMRVALWEIRADRRGNMMYRAVPAPDLFSDRWKDNGDGTASRVTILTDWLGKESEVGVVETRPFAQREGAHTTRSDYRIVWGSSLMDSIVEDHQIEVIPTDGEYVFNSTLSWKKVGERSEPRPMFTFPITELRVNNTNLWWMARHMVEWASIAAVQGEVFFQTSGGQVLRTALATTFGDMPEWWKKEQEAKFPVCSCTRQRRDAQTSDDYSKCEICRKEEKCARCGQQKTVELIGGKLICSTCKPLEKVEQDVEQDFPPDARVAIALQAARVCSGMALPQEEGMAILRATMGHIPSEWNRNQFLDKWKTHSWFYFCEEAVYGTKLAHAALQILEFLPQAGGDGLIEMACWIAQGAHAYQNVADYYVVTQVEGKTFSPGDFANRTGYHLGSLLDCLAKRAMKGEVVLAERLRGSEADRIAAIEGFARLSETLGADHKEVKQVVEILRSEEQDYRKAVELIGQIDYRLGDRQRAIDAGEVWPDVKIHPSTESRTHTDVFAIGQDGLIVDPINHERGGKRDRHLFAYAYGDLPNSVLVVEHSHNNYAYQNTERWQVHYLPTKLSEAQVTTLRRVEEETRYYFTGPGTGWDLRQVGLVSFSTAYHKRFDGIEAQLDQEMCSSLPIDVTQWEQSVGDDGHVVVGPYRHRSKEVKAVQQTEDVELDARGWLMTLEAEKELAKPAYEEAFEAWAERDGIKDGSEPVKEGTVFLVPQFVCEDNKGRQNLAFGPFYDWAAGRQLKLILDPFAQASAQVNEQSRDVLVRVRARNSEQVDLFETFLRLNPGVAKARTFGYLVIPVPSPEDFDRQIAEAEVAHQAAEQKLEQAKRAADYVAAKKRKEQEEVRTVAEVPTTLYSSSAESLNPLAEKLQAALERKK